MPRFARVFEGMTGDLPWSARAMVVWSQWLHANSQLALLAAAGTALVLAASALSQSTRAAVLRAVLNIAPLQRRLRTYWLSRWYRSTGMLVQGGIPLSQALPLSLGVLPTLLQAQASEVAQAVHDGLAPAAAYARAGMVTPVAEQLLLAGERTGDLGSVLTRIAQYHEADVSRTLERTMRALEPVVMVCVGVGVGLIVVLMYLPIFELAAAIR